MSRQSMYLCVCAVLVSCAGSVRAEVQPHNLFTEGAVLQQGMPVPVWGTGRDGEKVTVTFGRSRAATVVRDGRWLVRLPAMKASATAGTLTIQGDNRVEIKNVLVGEVWICSGQSNMQWPISASAEPEKVIAESADPGMRLFTVPRRATDVPLANVDARWVECGPRTTPDFSAVAYHFGRMLRKALKVPVGLISTNFGGTPAEAWTRREVLAADPELAPILERHIRAVEAFGAAYRQYLDAAAAWRPGAGERPRRPADPAESFQRPCGLYNAMIAPLIPYAIAGAIWYQGESNAGRAYEYRRLFPAMIRNWREDWGQGDFPFLYVQLAPFMRIQAEPMESAWAELREAQTMTLRLVPRTGMAVITDLGDEADIHPKRKAPVGERLALAALRIAYGKPIVYSGPMVAGHSIRGRVVTLRFTHVGGGLRPVGEPLTGFTVAGADRKWHNAQARVVGNTVRVWSDAVQRPVAVRFGWANYPVVNLRNAEGLPASPFRTDDWPGVTAPRR